MITMLGHYLNKSVVVSLPLLFPDGPACVGLLVGIEAAGIWLESAALTREVHADREPPPGPTRVFIPFGQIAYLIEDVAPQQDPRRDGRVEAQETPEERVKPTATRRVHRGGKPARKSR